MSSSIEGLSGLVSPRAESKAREAVVPRRSRPTASSGAVKSAHRTLRILDVLGATQGPVEVTQLHEQTGYPRSSLHQLLHTMAEAGWVSLSPDGTLASIGTRALVVGTSYLDRDDALVPARRTLEQVRDRTGWTSHYARLDGANVIYLATREASDARRASRVGRQLPASATSLGKALLAELTDAEVSQLLPDPLPRLTEQSVAEMSLLQGQLAVIRARGFAMEREENTAGVSCVGTVVPYRIPATDAISCSLPLERATDDELHRVQVILCEEAVTLAGVLRSAGIR